MKTILTILFVTVSINSLQAAEGLICKGVNCAPVQIEETRGSGLIRFKDDQVKKLDGPASDKAQNKNYLFSEETDQEQGSDLRFNEISVGTCLIDPLSPKTFYKILEKDEKSTKVGYVVENEPHSYMLRGNFVFWKLPDTSNAFKKLKRFPCKRTPNLWDNDYVKGCVKTVGVGEMYCNPKKKFN